MRERRGGTLGIWDTDTDEYDYDNNDNLFIGRLRRCVSVGASQLAWVTDGVTHLQRCAFEDLPSVFRLFPVFRSGCQSAMTKEKDE